MFYYLCKVISTAASLLYPTYGSYKALRPAASVGRTPADQAAHLERWLMFWCVMGCVALWEQWAEWGVSWFPFYHEVKTLVVLWLVLPQIQGATYIYINHLSPFLTSHEGEIDAAMTNARASATKMGMDYLNRGLRQARAFLLGNLFVEPNAAGGASETGTGTETPAPDRPPVLAEPALMSGQQTTSAAAVSGLARFAGGLLRQYAPAAIAAGNVLLQPMNKTAASSSSLGTSSARAGSSSAGQDSEPRRRAARSRRQELEAELASLHDPDDAPLSSSTSASENESTSTTTAGGGVGSLSFVEIVKAEAREYAASAAATPREAGARPGGARKSGSWFGWSSSSGGGIDSAKKDA